MKKLIGKWQRIVEIDDELKTYRVIFEFERIKGKYQFESLASSLQGLYNAIMEYEKQGYGLFNEVVMVNQNKKK